VYYIPQTVTTPWTTACGYLVLATAASYAHARDVVDDYKVDNNNKWNN